MAGRNYSDLLAWQRSIELIVAAYALSSSWPKSEVFGLISQTRRAAVSIATNIAEGQGRGSDREFRRFLAISYGSLRELETCVVVGGRLGYGTDKQRTEVMRLAGEVGRLINGLSSALRRRTAS